MAPVRSPARRDRRGSGNSDRRVVCDPSFVRSQTTRPRSVTCAPVFTSSQGVHEEHKHLHVGKFMTQSRRERADSRMPYGKPTGTKDRPL
ncbi:Hypothetical protein SMAX5B_017018 [Scophthalmus maximus]|uniref:Uncharacterized protein n=1 Tax=Scophthalmus maximus TaxID=52904 RepID=A0A2U9B9Q8_SCOMX|nr:Hypothetical protein SMAX5B_017018 [Scophthalmus maximus]KAF0038901.1 hypothetical protein F2P81_009385 [Scophthalmus maximus]